MNNVAIISLQYAKNTIDILQIAMYNIWYVGGNKMLEGMTELQKSVLSSAIKYHRCLKRMTQMECAEALSVSISTYRRLENHPNEIELNDMFILSEVLEWNIIDFFLKYVLHIAIKDSKKVLR